MLNDSLSYKYMTQTCFFFHKSNMNYLFYVFRDIFGREIMVVAVIKSMWPTKYIRAHIEHKPRISHLSLPEPTLPELCSYTNWKGDSSAKVVNMLSAHIGKSKKYTIQEKRRCPKFTFSTFTPDPNLHKSQIYTGPIFTQVYFRT